MKTLLIPCRRVWHAVLQCLVLPCLVLLACMATVQAATLPADWSSRSCSGCHSTPPSGNPGGSFSPINTTASNYLNASNFLTFMAGSSRFSGGLAVRAMTSVYNDAQSTQSTNRDSADRLRVYLYEITSGTTAPTANAGTSRSVLRGTNVSLSGSGGVSYAWTVVSSTGGVSNLTTATPSFVATVVGTYEIALVVSNASGATSVPARISITVNTNNTPTADAGPDQSVLIGSSVSLAGSGTDPDAGTTLQYSWSFTARPVGSVAAVLAPTLAVTSFTADKRGQYDLQLQVSDGVNQRTDSVTIVANRPPLASAGSNQQVLQGATVSLSGSGSDPDNDSITSYTWTLTRPDNSTQALTGQTPSFTAAQVGNYSAALVVSDGLASSSNASSVQIGVSAVNPQMTTAVAPAGVPDVQVGLSTLKTVTVTNTGNAPLSFTADPQAAARLIGSAAFSIVSGGSCSLGTTLAAPVAPATSGGSCTISVRFLPTTLGNGQTAQLSLPSNAGNSPAALTLSGNSVALPPMQAAPSTLAFPDTAFGDVSAAQTITLTNDRASTVSYALDRHGNTDFVIVDDGSTACPGRVVPARSGATSGQCTLQVAFNPQPTGGATARSLGLTVSFTAPPGEPTPTAIDIALSGIAKLALRPSLTDLSLTAVASTTTATATVALSNQSAATITLGSLVLGGSGASVFSIDASSTCTAALARAPGASCLVVLRYSPTQAGTQDATLTVTHGAPGSPVNVSLHGTATPAPQGRLEVGATTVAFADTQLAASSTQTLLLHNAGNKLLSFSAFELGGSAAADYTVSTAAPGSCSLSVPLAISGDCVLTLALRPGALGLRNATLTLRSDGSNPALPVGLSGNGIPVPVPVLSFVGAAPTDTALDFGPQTLGGLYPTRLVRVVNTGTAALRISAVAVIGTGFALADASACVADLAPQASCSIAVGFAPTAAGQSFAGTLRLTSNASGSPHGFDLLGSGVAYVVPVLAWAAPGSDLQFGNVSAGSVSATQSITLRNLGPGGATLRLLSTVGLEAAVFLVGTDDAADNTACRAGKLLLEGDSCRVDVRFVPGASGLRSAGLQVVSSGSAPAARQVQGTGLASTRALLQLSGTVLDFGATRSGAQSLPLALVLSSPEGAGAVRVTALALSGPFQIVGGNCPALPFVLAAGSSCTLSLGHAPQGAGAATGSLQVDSDAGPAQVVALQGRGEAAPTLSSGGCTLVDGRRAAGSMARDPTLWALVVLAAAALGWRRLRRRAPAQPAGRP